jgi:ribosomal protein S18 acetylase RimI-like enzyme
LLGHPGLTARTVVLRAACEEDTAFLRVLFESARPDGAFLAAWPEGARRVFLDQQFGFQSLHYARTYPNAERLVVLKDGAAVGRMILHRAPAEWCLVDIALLPAWRRQGIGTLLLQAVLAAAERAAVGSVCLSVDPRNPAQRLYERLGFIAEDEEPGMASLGMAWRPSPPQLKTA